MSSEHQDVQETQALVPIEDEFPSELRFQEVNAQIETARELVREHLQEDVDYGTIEGTDRDTLYKTGAEKITQIFGTRPDFEIIHRVEDWAQGLFAYEVRCSLVSVRTGAVLAQGLGECNSYEPKYRYRNAQRVCTRCGQETVIKGKTEYGGGWLCWRNKGGCGERWDDGNAEIEGQEVGKIENPDRAGQRNTIIKMGKKRAHVDAALGIGALSAIFTQDIDEANDPGANANVARPQAQARVEPKPANGNGGADTAPEYPRDFEHVGHLMTAATHRLGMQPREIVSILEVDYPSEITDIQGSWDRLVEAHDAVDNADPADAYVGAPGTDEEQVAF